VSELAIVVRTEPHPDGAADLGVVGPITHETAFALRDAVSGVMHTDPSGPCPRLRLDLSCCTNVDVDGLLALAVSQQAARDLGGDLYIDQVPPLVERQVRQHNFDILLSPGAGERSGPA
jgi:ABC-type transporter Mla MlaB component